MPKETLPTTEKKRKERPNKRALILHTALNVFSYYGYEGASLDKIAGEAGVVKSLIIKYFDSKENLAVLTTRQFLEMFVAKVQRIGKKELSYKEHVGQVARLFKRYRKELRFIIGLLSVPHHDVIAAQIWSDGFATVASVVPFEEEAPEGVYDDMVYTMMALHVQYIIEGNEARYDRARDTLLEKYLR